MLGDPPTFEAPLLGAAGSTLQTDAVDSLTSAARVGIDRRVFRKLRRRGMDERTAEDAGQRNRAPPFDLDPDASVWHPPSWSVAQSAPSDLPRWRRQPPGEEDALAIGRQESRHSMRSLPQGWPADLVSYDGLAGADEGGFWGSGLTEALYGEADGASEVQLDFWVGPPPTTRHDLRHASLLHLPQRRRRRGRSDPVSRGSQMRALWSRDRFLRCRENRKFDLRGCGPPEPPLPTFAPSSRCGRGGGSRVALGL